MAPRTSDSDPLKRATFAILEEDGARPRGTGVLIGPRHVLTCFHVVEGLDQVFVRGVSETEACAVSVLKEGRSEGAEDLAVLELNEPRLLVDALRFGPPRVLREFISLGFPSRARDTVYGKVLLRSQYFELLELEETGSHTIAPGFSGSAVWDPEKEVAVGLVVRKHPSDRAYAIPIDKIRAFWPQLMGWPELELARSRSAGRTDLEAQPKIPNLGNARFVRIVDAVTGTRLGHGFRIHETSVLTVSEVALASASLAVEDPAGLRVTPRPGQIVWPPLDRARTLGVVLLETRPAAGVLPYRSLSSSTPLADHRWKSLVHTGAGSRLEYQELGGRVGVELPEGSQPLLLEEVNGSSVEALAEALGSGVFVVGENGKWVLAGILGWRSLEDGPVLELRSLDALRAWEGFAARLAIPRASKRWRRVLRSVERLLRAPDVLLAVVEADPEELWQEAGAEGTAALAAALCLESQPRRLAEALGQAYEHLLDENEKEAAEKVYEILLHALAVAICIHWNLDPDRSATEIHLELLSDVLAEFVLAAVGDAPADFHRLPRVSDSDIPPATHELRRPGELGADPDDEEAALELAKDLENRLLLDGGWQSDRKEAEAQYIAQFATRKYTPNRGLRLIDRTKLRELDHRTDEVQGTAALIFQFLNRQLARGTSRGRNLYMVSRPENESLIQGLRRVLPDLPIVTLQASNDQFSEGEHEDVRFQLAKIFSLRR